MCERAVRTGEAERGLADASQKEHKTNPLLRSLSERKSRAERKELSLQPDRRQQPPVACCAFDFAPERQAGRISIVNSFR
jgi:hypothetical protein